MARRNRGHHSKDEPELDTGSSDWVEFGGELIFAVDETPGGAPVGLTASEHRRLMEEQSHEQGWARAKRLLRRAFTRPGEEAAAVGRVVHVGEGLSRDAYAAEVEHRGGRTQAVVLLPRTRDPERDRRTLQEHRLLARLAPLPKAFRVPRPIAVLPTPLGPALVREFVRGVDLRAGVMPGGRPWALVAELAAAVHALPLESLGELRGHATRRAHGEAELSALAGLERDRSPVVGAALEWLAAHLPPDEPATLVHGDLLGQNILLSPLEDSPTQAVLIDWEFALRGDPAHDLAIVTRGVRRPFQLPDGFERLLDAYRAASARALEPREVRFHELCLLLGLVRDAKIEGVRQQYLHQLEIVLQHVR